LDDAIGVIKAAANKAAERVLVISDMGSLLL
jgi:hypothetical protein